MQVMIAGLVAAAVVVGVIVFVGEYHRRNYYHGVNVREVGRELQARKWWRNVGAHPCHKGAGELCTSCLARHSCLAECILQAKMTIDDCLARGESDD